MPHTVLIEQVQYIFICILLTFQLKASSPGRQYLKKTTTIFGELINSLSSKHFSSSNISTFRIFTTF